MSIDTSTTPTFARRRLGTSGKRKYSDMSLGEALELIPVAERTLWEIDAESYPASVNLETNLVKLRSFDTQSTEPGKELLIDALLAEIIFLFPNLKIWKGAILRSKTLTGVADYLVALRRDYVKTPLLCAVEAKKDDFVQGAAQCIAEMVACRANNREERINIPVYGIVSNGQGWQFYQLTVDNILYATVLYSQERELPVVLGVLRHIFALCNENVQQYQSATVK